MKKKNVNLVIKGLIPRRHCRQFPTRRKRDPHNTEPVLFTREVEREKRPHRLAYVYPKREGQRD